MSNSPLIAGTLLTNNCTSPRTHKINAIVPHYMEGFLTAEECCRLFLPASRRASANYCIGKYGEIWLNVEEKNRAWTTGDASIDNRAVTIECANYMEPDRYGKLPDSTWNSLVKLCADIAIRNEMGKLVYTGDKRGNLHMHKWYQDTDCPGKWLSTQFERLANEANKIISGDSPSPTPVPPMVFGGTYRCRVNGLHVRTQPNLNGQVVAEYNNGDTVVLDDWYTSNDGYIWGRYTGASSGKLRYVAVGRDTGKVEPDDYLVKI